MAARPLALGNLTMSGGEGGWRNLDRLHQSQEGAGGTTFARHGDLPQRPKFTTPKRPSKFDPLGRSPDGDQAVQDRRRDDRQQARPHRLRAHA